MYGLSDSLNGTAAQLCIRVGCAHCTGLVGSVCRGIWTHNTAYIAGRLQKTWKSFPRTVALNSGWCGPLPRVC